MRVVIRVDSSVDMGSGHVMRCLALASKFKQEGVRVSFLCRKLPGNLGDFVVKQGFEVDYLPLPGIGFMPSVTDVAHASWLGVGWWQDAEETRLALGADKDIIDWLVVDHYALDRRWEGCLRPFVRHIMVIDDLADRHHDCDLLLDQNLVEHMDSRYDMLLSDTCKRLLGPCYALLRPEFWARRDLALVRRDKTEKVERLLVTLGGMDPDNVTGMVLEGVEKACVDVVVDVVMGENAPYLEDVRQQAERMTAAVEVHVASKNMAELMGKADFAVGAGGVTSWERCVLGLPSIIITTAKNQEPIAAGLVRLGAVKWLGTSEQVDSRCVAAELRVIFKQLDDVKGMSLVARRLCDGNGTGRVVEEMVG
ncbi:UDP-2,4-diacetamido-2,4,6-trideoxy-beta-L-altropyranose hydrolase [Thermodesulfobacteriota bacterium]